LPIRGDARLAERMVANLVDNALRHNVDAGVVEVRTGSGTLSVVNTGPLIPTADVARLFQPFQRLATARAGHDEGLGLGLSIVRAVTDAHGATVAALPRPTGGLEITVTFPRQ
jgi:signal transduction histidine kinase